jgi:hypothetical protein
MRVVENSTQLDLSECNTYNIVLKRSELFLNAVNKLSQPLEFINKNPINV